MRNPRKEGFTPASKFIGTPLVARNRSRLFRGGFVNTIETIDGTAVFMRMEGAASWSLPHIGRCDVQWNGFDGVFTSLAAPRDGQDEPLHVEGFFPRYSIEDRNGTSLAVQYASYDSSMRPIRICGDSVNYFDLGVMGDPHDPWYLRRLCVVVSNEQGPIVTGHSDRSITIHHKDANVEILLAFALYVVCYRLREPGG